MQSVRPSRCFCLHQRWILHLSACICACRKMANMSSWAWFPSKCSMETFDALRLSRKLAGREVLAIGDSIGVRLPSCRQR